MTNKAAPSAGLQAGSLNQHLTIAGAITKAIDDSGLSRDEVAMEMSRLLSRKVTKVMLNAYSARSRRMHNFTAGWVAALEAVTGSHAITKLIARANGWTLSSPEKEVARIEERIRRLQAERESLLAKSALKEEEKETPNGG